MRVYAATAAAMILGALLPASAVIKIDFPVSRVYQEAAIVAVGEVSRVMAGRGIECTMQETLKGQMAGSKVTMDAPAELAKDLKPTRPVVAFIQGNRGIFHLADAWYSAEGKADGRWTITGPYPMVKNYPGRTEGLVSVLRQIKAGKPGIKDGIGHEFVGSIRDLGNLGVKPTFLTAADLNGDGSIDLLVGTAEGVRLFLAEGERYSDVTESWGLKGVSCKHAVTGDVNGDGKPDILLGKALWYREGSRFAKAPVALDLPAEATWASATLADVNGDKLTDVVALARTGALKTALNPGAKGGDWTLESTTLWTGGESALAAVFSEDWGDDGAVYVLVVHPTDIVRYPVGRATAPRSDFKRLTGIPLSQYPKIGPMPLQVDLCTGLDYDGSGRADLLVVTRGGGITLANRGYGTMLINGFMHTQFRSNSEWKPAPKIPRLGFELTPSVHVAPGKKGGRSGKAQHLLILRGDGQFFEMINDR
jgi:hypothetical protein